MGKPTAVVLFNLGGPDSLEAVEPFLFNLFSDPDIFKFPLGFVTQKWFARAISRRRAPKASIGYRAIGGKSPQLEITKNQARALNQKLSDKGDYEVYVCMRYWHPMADAVVATLKQNKIENVILLPLYPQYSLTTTGSSYNDFQRACRRSNYRPKISFIKQWYDDAGYQQAIVSTILAEAARMPDPDPDNIELLFSAHGLPQKIIDQGDPYEKQIRATIASLNKILGWPRTTLCYQSRVGPLKWLQPYTHDTISKKARQGSKQILVYPVAFVSDHIETLYELGTEYAEVAREAGVESYRVVPALNASAGLIDTLQRLVLSQAHAR
ncbi:MAG: ferrochelatase [Acidiferrobacterales bacterium]